MSALTVIKQAQKELVELNKIMGLNEDLLMLAEMQIDIQSASYDGSESITQFVDRCVEIASI